MQLIKKEFNILQEKNLFVQGGPEKKKKLFKVIYPQKWPFSFSHLAICVSFLERFN